MQSFAGGADCGFVHYTVSGDCAGVFVPEFEQAPTKFMTKRAASKSENDLERGIESPVKLGSGPKMPGPLEARESRQKPFGRVLDKGPNCASDHVTRLTYIVLSLIHSKCPSKAPNRTSTPWMLSLSLC